MNEQKQIFPENAPTEKAVSAHSRRQFLGIAGVLAGAGLIGLSSCKKDDNKESYDSGVGLGSGDAGVVNYLYALKQITTAFYRQVTASSTSAFPDPKEMARLQEILAHETAHSRFLQEWMTQLGIAPIQALTANFSTVNFSDRINVLQVAQTLEDLSVAACNGAGKLLKSAKYLLMAGKMGSVDARHAAFVHDLQSNGSFADLVALAGLGADDVNGLDGALSPAQVISQLGKYSRQRLDASKLPTY